MYIQVVFPISTRKAFTYSVPLELEGSLSVGKRVVVPFGKRVLTGFVVSVSDDTDVKEKIKSVTDVLDETPIFNAESLKFYEWIADYYISSLGEALKNSVPYGLEVESKKRVIADSDQAALLFQAEKNKNSTRGKLLSILSEKESCTISTLQKLAQKKSIYSVLNTLEREGAVTILNRIEDAKVRVKTVKHVRLAKHPDEIYGLIPEIENRSPKQVVILLELLQHHDEEDHPMQELLKKTGAGASSVKSLEEKEIVEIFDKEIERTYTEEYEEAKKGITITKEQSVIIEEVGTTVEKEEFAAYLLHGVTGSGKTQVYIELAEKALNKGKTVLVLVPEISLTPQITTRFLNRFGEVVGVMHSRMSLGERYDTWRGVINGKYKIVIGPRSALFAPLKNTGLIIIDEEHDGSYKQQETTPKYHARDAAVMKANFNNCPVLLGSATPSIESMYNAETGKYKLLELKTRIDNAKLPKIKLIDIRKSGKHKDVIFSKEMLDEIALRLHREEGVIILQNRRGFSTNVYCSACGEVFTCKDCSVPMVFHISRNHLKCHYCNYIVRNPNQCPTCGSLELKYMGTGTQKVEDELEAHFPGIKLERVDSDSMTKKGKLSSILNDFKEGKIQVLVGTQMVSKGLDFSNVTLVCVVSAETSLWIPDFRSDERTFQLLTQVAGRAGRSKKEGEVLIQTFDVTNRVLMRVLSNDYTRFYNEEAALRKSTKYPPFSKLCLIEVSDENEKRAEDSIKQFYSILKPLCNSLKLNPPVEAVIYKLKGRYRWHILLQSDKEADPSGKVLRNAVMNAYVKFNSHKRSQETRLSVDMDPQSMV